MERNNTRDLAALTVAAAALFSCGVLVGTRVGREPDPLAGTGASRFTTWVTIDGRQYPVTTVSLPGENTESFIDRHQSQLDLVDVYRSE